MSDIEQFRKFKAAGPVSSAFIKDMDSLVAALLGPVGGGKTVANVYKAIYRASRMPACNDGVIRYRRAIIGSTYGQIERNLYPTWWRWLPKDSKTWTEGEWQGGGGRFATQFVTWDVTRRDKDGQRRSYEVRAEFIFAAIGDLVVEEFMRGFEPTEFYLYEMDQLPRAVIPLAITRRGRFPPKGDAPDALPQNHGFKPQISGCLNAPDTGSWFYEVFEEDVPPGYQVYKQPSGVSPKAENTASHDPDYYTQMIEALSRQKGGKNLIKRMVHAQYAPTQIGDPVFADEYDDDVHLAPVPLRAAPGIPLVMGFDQGLGMPAAVLAQFMPNGQCRVLDECVPGRMSERRFADKVRAMIEDVAPNVPIAEVHYADPAGFDGADKEDGQLAWAEIVMRELGIYIAPTDTNSIDIRLTAVTDELTYRIEPTVPGLLISPRCKMLRKGFVSHYMYEKRPDEKSQNLKPVKNNWSNPHDALQYLLLGKKGRYGVIEGKRNPNAPERALGHKSKRRGSDDGCTVIKAPVEL